MSKPTVSLTEDAYIDIRPYPESYITPILPFEVEMCSGNKDNDGLVLNTTLARITFDQAIALRDRLIWLIEDHLSKDLDKSAGW